MPARFPSTRKNLVLKRKLDRTPDESYEMAGGGGDMINIIPTLMYGGGGGGKWCIHAQLLLAVVT